MPDFTSLIGLSPTTPDKAEADAGGDAGLSLVVEERHLNSHETLHGGVLATLADSVMGQAVRDRLDDGRAPVTVSMTVTYLAPAVPGDELHAVAEVRRSGAKILITEADITRTSDGAAIAHAIATFSSVSEA